MNKLRNFKHVFFAMSEKLQKWREVSKNISKNLVWMGQRTGGLIEINQNYSKLRLHAKLLRSCMAFLTPSFATVRVLAESGRAVAKEACI